MHVSTAGARIGEKALELSEYPCAIYRNNFLLHSHRFGLDEEKGFNYFRFVRYCDVPLWRLLNRTSIPTMGP